MATLDELAVFCASAASLTVGTTLFKGQMPSTPDACVSLHEYPGLPPTMVFGQSAIAAEYPRVQVVVRGTAGNYATPRTTAETLYKAMAAANHQSIVSTTTGRYLAMEPQQPPFLMGKDDQNRLLIGFNCQITKELSA